MLRIFLAIYDRILVYNTQNLLDQKCPPPSLELFLEIPLFWKVQVSLLGLNPRLVAEAEL